MGKCIIARDFAFSSKCNKKRLAAVLRPDPLGSVPSVSALPGLLDAVRAREGHTPYGRSCGRFSARKEWNYVEAEYMNERDFLQIRNRQRFYLQVNACLTAGFFPDRLRERKRSQDLGLINF